MTWAGEGEQEERIWKAMKSRCSSKCYKDSYYQKEGIKVCEEWGNSFEQFLEDMGKIPGDDYSIERIDIRKDYCPENCKWIPMRDQPINRRNTLWYAHDGETLTLKVWSRRLGINYDTLRARVVRRNIPVEIAISIYRAGRLLRPLLSGNVLSFISLYLL